MESPKLTVELVPQTCWFSNIRSEVPGPIWDIIRRRVYKDCHYRCEICGGKGPKWPVEAHEIWVYDDINHTQTLIGMSGLCPNCHSAKHIGLAVVHNRFEGVFKHLLSVNSWTPEEGSSYLAAEEKKWQIRSQHQWTLYVGGLQYYLGPDYMQFLYQNLKQPSLSTIPTPVKGTDGVNISVPIEMAPVKSKPSFENYHGKKNKRVVQLEPEPESKPIEVVKTFKRKIDD